MDVVNPLTKLEQLLLMAAAVHGLGPTTNLHVANTARVVGQALKWAGLMNDEVGKAWRELENHPAIDHVCEVLTRMTAVSLTQGRWRAPELPGEVLFEGAGNWGEPGDPGRAAAYPHFTSCRLTGAGERLAQELLDRHPEYRKAT